VGLTSPALPYLLALLAVGALLAIIVDWRAMAARNARSVVHRTVSLLGLQFFVLAFIFVTVNRSGEFYSSWSDLFGQVKASGSVVAATNTGATRIQPVVVTSRAPVATTAGKSAGGVLESVTFNGPISGVSVSGQVFLPAGYRPVSRVGHYPVLVEISDNLANTSSSYAAARLAETAARQIAMGQLAPLIIVMLPASVVSGDQGCLDLAAQPASSRAPGAPALMAATFFTQDLPAALESQFGASSNSVNWGLLGDNGGGYCALQLALTHSWVFSAAVVPDGPYTGPPGPAIAAESRDLRLQDNLQWLLINQPMQPVSVLFTNHESASAASAQLFATATTPPMHVEQLAIRGGGWPLAPILNWIGATIGPHTTHGPPAVTR